MPEFLTIRQEVKKYGLVSEARLRQMQRQGTLPGIYSGSRFYVEHNQLVKILMDQVNQSVRAAVNE